MGKEIIAYTINGFPIDKDEYISLVNEADERVSTGKYTTIEDLEKEIENW